MTKLPANFELDKYGLHVRFVSEDDARFIVALRTSPIKARYISATSCSVEDQKDWILAYKEREKKGTDYYFMYIYKGKEAGVNRIYDIEGNHFIYGSWIFSDDVPPYCALASGIIARDIAFDTLGLEVEIDSSGVHKDNHSVLQYIRTLGAELLGERVHGADVFFTSKLTKETFNENKHKIIRLFPKKVQ